MYELNDTIAAVSSPTSDNRVIVRISGPDTVDICKKIFSHQVIPQKTGLTSGSITVEPELEIDAKLYLFPAPHSYTGDDIAEIHIYTNPSVTEALMSALLSEGIRAAGPGEFTARAYLNGKIDLAQAEAVNEIITSSNKFQLAAAEKLLSGRLSQTAAEIGSSLMDCISLIEAGLDFSGEDIEFITGQEAIDRITQIKKELENLLAGGISYESVADLPAVGIAGAPNAGKSRLLNKLLGKARSIVSARRRTTRDVLTAVCTLSHCRCVLFDCAGLDAGCSILDTRYLKDEQQTIVDELAQQAAIEALQNSSLVVFCVDISKTDWAEDASIRRHIKTDTLIPVATKSDLLCEDILAERLAKLNKVFNAKFLATSSKTGSGIERLKGVIDEKIVEQRAMSIEHQASSIALTARHKQTITDAIENAAEAVGELKSGNDEVAAMILRAAYNSICDIESADWRIDEQILENIFSRFCVGK